MNSKKKQKKNFLNLPVYPGGKKAFGLFIKKNLKYPSEAIENKVQGDVMVTYEVDDNGMIHHVSLKHGIGFGCDQEAIRLVKMLNFPKTKNHGVRVKSKFTTKIPFRLPAMPQTVNTAYNYQIKPKAVDPKPAVPEKRSYSWQIDLNNGLS